MKKKYYLRTISYASLALMASCSSEEVKNEQDGMQIFMSAPDFRFASESRTSFEITDTGAEFKWADGDTVGVFPDKGHQVDFPMLGSSGTKTARFDGGGWALKQSSKYAAYFPFIGNTYLEKTKIPVAFTNQTQVGNGTTGHLGKCDYMAASANTPEEGKVSFSFKHLGCLIELNVILPEKGDMTSITLIADEPLFTTEGIVDLTTAQPTIKSTHLSDRLTINVKDLVTTEDKTAVKVYAMIAPANLQDKTIHVEAYNNGYKRKGSVQGRNFEAGNAYQLAVALEGQKPILDAYHVEKAGTLAELIGEENKTRITKLKVTGELNGTDIRFIREMSGTVDYGDKLQAKLAHLDMYGARIVEGGEPYINGYVTTNNTIGYGMFNSCITLEDVILPKDVTVIGNGAFDNCKKLTTINLHEGITHVGNYAFNYCPCLNNMTFPESLEYLGEGALQGCFGLTSISLPKSIIAIPDALLNECAGLTSVSIPNEVTTIGSNAFSNCYKLKSINIPSGVTSIGASAFYNCQSLTSIELPKNLTIIESNLLYNCDKLTSIIIPAGVTSIGYQAFSSCDGIKEISIPDKVTQVGQYAFRWSSNLRTINVLESRTVLNERFFNSADNCRTLYFPKTLKEIQVGSLPPNLNEMHCPAIEPPTLHPASNLNHYCKIYVPEGSVQKYKNAEVWKDYAANIVAIKGSDAGGSGHDMPWGEI